MVKEHLAQINQLSCSGAAPHPNIHSARGEREAALQRNKYTSQIGGREGGEGWKEGDMEQYCIPTNHPEMGKISGRTILCNGGG